MIHEEIYSCIYRAASANPRAWNQRAARHQGIKNCSECALIQKKIIMQAARANVAQILKNEPSGPEKN